MYTYTYMDNEHTHICTCILVHIWIMSIPIYMYIYTCMYLYNTRSKTIAQLQTVPCSDMFRHTNCLDTNSICIFKNILIYTCTYTHVHIYTHNICTIINSVLYRISRYA